MTYVRTARGLVCPACDSQLRASQAKLEQSLRRLRSATARLRSRRLR